MRNTGWIALGIILLIAVVFLNNSSGTLPEHSANHECGAGDYLAGLLCEDVDTTDAATDGQVPKYDAAAGLVKWEADAGGVGSGDIDNVGDCATGDCFSGTGSGTTLTFHGATSGTTIIAVPSVVTGQTITFPNETGTVCTTGAVCYPTATPQPTATPYLAYDTIIGTEATPTPLPQQRRIQFTGIACTDSTGLLATACAVTTPTPQPTPTVYPTPTPYWAYDTILGPEATPVPFTQRRNLRFVGDGIVCVDNPGLGATNCTVPTATPQPTPTVYPTPTIYPTPTPSYSAIVFVQAGNISTGTSVGGGRIYAQWAMTIVSPYVSCSVTTAPTTSAVTLDIHYDGTTIFTTQGSRPSIAATAFTDSSDAPEVTSIAGGGTHYLTMDIDAVDSGDTAADLVCQVVVR